MAICGFQGNSDMYGLGIRIGFYLQWFCAIIAEHLEQVEEVHGLRLAYYLFILAVFISLLIQVSNSSLHLVEVYIVSLLVFGGFYVFVPISMWQLYIRFDPNLDPSRWLRVSSSRWHIILVSILLVSQSCFQIWFWSTPVRTLNGQCGQYGFFFTRVPLNNGAFVALNMLVAIFLLAYGLTLVCVNAGWLNWGGTRGQLTPRKRINAMQNFTSAVRLIAFGVIVTASELAVRWNQITDVNSVSPAGQTIPIVIGIGGILRVIYTYMYKTSPTSRSDSSVVPGS